ncbi:MAG TPA: nucleotidyltransferase family protein [Vicinamibacterales bacterium]|nr:nucleotidyltransferase family protein [Vicinamibacterales bacterium]
MQRPIVVILARGLGTRMRRGDPGAALADEQARVADTGVKAMIPIGRPFLDYVLSGLADAGLREVCLVIGPEHGAIREYYGTTARPSRLHIEYAIQARPLGTADAVASASDVVGERPCLVLNSDNYYPVEAYRALVAMDGPGLVAFERDAMARLGNVPAERAGQLAVVRIGSDGHLLDVIEKPDEATLASLGSEVYLSMNCWRFDRTVLDACGRVAPSARGERELPDAVRLAQREGGTTFRVVRLKAGVLDLSSRSDVAGVARHLAGVEVRL